MPVSDPGLEKPSALSPKKVDLPPAGDARREELLKRLDALNKEGERIATELGIERIDPARFRPDHDAQVAAHRLGIGVDPNAEVGVQGMQKDKAYVLVWGDPRGTLGNRVFWAYRKEGWETVGPGTPEWEANRNSQASDGTLRWADCVLMSMPRAQHDALKKKQLALRIAREEGVPAAMLELAERAGTKATYGELPTEGGPDSIAAQAMRAASMNTAARQGVAMQIAQKRFDEALRAGTLHRR